MITIRDNGKGMDRETLKRIFEPFFTLKPSGRGTGMGLAAIYGTVQKHGGSIDAESTGGSGTTVCICLPPSKKSKEHDKPEKGESEPKKSHLRILFIDDDDSVKNMADMVFTRLGHTLHSFTDSSQALGWYAQAYKTVDIIVFDMVMPGLPAGEVYSGLRAINPDAQVILTSGYSMNEEIQDLINPGAYGFIKKPFEISQIIQLMLQAVHCKQIT